MMFPHKSMSTLKFRMRLFGNRFSADEIKRGSYWVRMVFNPVTGVLKIRRKDTGERVAM